MKRNYIKTFGIALTAVATFSSCSDSFLEDKKNYDNVSTDVYNYYSGALARVDDVYSWCLPDCTAEPSYKYNSTGLADDHSKCTEEYSGFGVFVDPEALLTYQSGNNPVPDYFHYQSNNIQASTWGRIRNCNDAIEGVAGGDLSTSEKNELLGQLYFLRAWCYYNLVKWYGGVPIIKEVQDPTADAVVPRSTTKECIDFICEDLDNAADMLYDCTASGGWASSDDWGRVTSGTALALKGRILLWWASPLFNRSNDTDRWKDAYEAIEESIPVIDACGYSLVGESDPGTNASAWANMFATNTSKEGIFITLYNTLESGGSTSYYKNNTWENGIRPTNAMGGGGKNPSAMLVDMFPMADGKRPPSCTTYTVLNSSDYSYNSEYPFMNRDPRFYRTFAFPGERWAFSGDPTGDDNNNPYEGSSYVLWNYVWYENLTAAGEITGSSYGSDNLLSNAKGFYIRKRSDDYDINSSSSYVFDTTQGGTSAFKRSGAPYLELRYAEVLLNLAEAACGAGYMSEAVEQLQRIRARVGYTADNNYGLQSDLSSNQAACMAAILYERQIELAYEGKRFDDMRRWMLFDGGAVSVSGAPSSWTLTGWGGNTCTYLGFKQMNGQRRENLEFRVQDDYNNGIGGTTWSIGGTNPDPLYGVAYGDGVTDARAAAVMDLRNPAADEQDDLKSFYETYLERKTKRGDAYDSNSAELYCAYQSYYYFLGLGQSAMSNNPTLEQTIGWGDYNNGGANGTFDPLAE